MRMGVRRRRLNRRRLLCWIDILWFLASGCPGFFGASGGVVLPVHRNRVQRPLCE